MLYREALRRAQHLCIDAGVGEQAPLFLLLELANLESHNLYAEFDQEMDDALVDAYYKKVDRLLAHEPLDHILGYSYFYGFKFLVNEDVLIPRPETEELVANVLASYDEFFAGQEVEAIDVGCGSGAIAIAVALEEKNIHMQASDISEHAIAVAKENAKNLEANVAFKVGDMLQPFIESNHKVDILISNPPYIPQDEKMEDSVVDFEPHVALFGGSDGLHFYKEIFKHAHKVIKGKSFLAFEIGYNQKDALLKEADIYFPNDKKEVLKDLNGKDRMLFIYHNV